MASSIEQKINDMQKQLNQLKKQASDEATGKGIKQAFAEIRATKERGIAKGTRVMAAYSKQREEQKMKPLTDAGWVKTFTAPDGTMAFGKKGSSLYVHLKGDAFTVKAGMNANAEVIQAKTSFEQIGSFLKNHKPGPAQNLPKPKTVQLPVKKAMPVQPVANHKPGQSLQAQKARFTF
ncbi:MAG: hypothetical protein JWQ09_1779 [Segetibacter sp.]|nr:hypothetical protein [Segetibacter sp.]